MGIPDGFPYDDDGSSGSSDLARSETEESRLEEKAVLWVVNPSSLAEWRRLEVEEANAALSAAEPAAADG